MGVGCGGDGLRTRRTRRPAHPSYKAAREIPTDMYEYTGQSCSLRKRSYAGGEFRILFSFETAYQEGEGQPPDRTRQDGLRLVFTPAVVLFIALPETENKTDPG